MAIWGQGEEPKDWFWEQRYVAAYGFICKETQKTHPASDSIRFTSGDFKDDFVVFYKSGLWFQGPPPNAISTRKYRCIPGLLTSIVPSLGLLTKRWWWHWGGGPLRFSRNAQFNAILTTARSHRIVLVSLPNPVTPASTTWLAWIGWHYVCIYLPCWGYFKGWFQDNGVWLLWSDHFEYQITYKL